MRAYKKSQENLVGTQERTKDDTWESLEALLWVPSAARSEPNTASYPATKLCKQLEQLRFLLLGPPSHLGRPLGFLKGVPRGPNMAGRPTK